MSSEDPLNSEDLAPLLVAPQGDPTAIRGGKGTVISWNAETGENVINFRGTYLTNLPIVSASTWVLLVQPGDTVLLNIFGTGGFATVYIVGPITPPGPEIRDIIRSTIANRIVAATDSTSGTRNTSTFGDLTGTSPGPSVTIDIGPSGKALVMWAAQRQNLSGYDISYAYGDSIRVSGATAIDPSGSYTAGFWFDCPTAGSSNTADSSRFHLFTGLNPGSTTFKMEYRSNSNDNCIWQEREIAVFAL